jgi:diguanylate cyclase (GGDEF)-like protein
MSRIYTCLTEAHDPWLLALAVSICLLGAGTTVMLLQRLALAKGLSRGGWLMISAIAAGAFIWCTHFIGMLAFDPGMLLAFDLLRTLYSLMLAALGCGAAFALASGGWRHGPLMGGAALGLAIGLMHYAGMTAYGGGSILSFDALLVGLSLMLGVLCGSLALPAALRGDSPGWRRLLEGAGWLSLAILSLHLTGMAALTVLPAEPSSLASALRAELALTVAAVGLLVLAAAAAAWMIDHRGHVESEGRLRRLADSAVEGLAITRNGRIIEANDAFVALSGERQRDNLLGLPLPGERLSLRDAIPGLEDGIVRREGWFHHPDGTALEVEVTVRDDAPEPGLQIFALSDLRERREHERRILHLAMHDPLTGLPNRARFAQRLDQILRHAGRQQPPQSLALLHLGFDRFKHVNDLHGHAGGDALLRGIGRRISVALPPKAFAARLGGDEFGVLLPFQEQVEVFELILRLEQAVAEPNYIGDGEVSITASTGIALFPADSSQGEELRAQADFAMRRAKEAPGRGMHFYQAKMDEAQRQRLRMASEMGDALQEGQFCLFAQIQMDIRTGLPCGHEMLLRWLHPQRGLVPPGDFIPTAEENGMILPIGDWVLREACRLAVENPELGKVAVNLSPVQFSQADLPRQVASALAESGLPPARLELEITESTLMQDPTRTLKMLEEIKAAGVKVVIDDFGTGYSSLATLRSFPFDKIKLDRKFLAEAEDSPAAIAILRAVIGIGRGLGIPVLAEGVETKAQLELLHSEGCDEAQGFLFGRPEPLQGNTAGITRQGASSGAPRA